MVAQQKILERGYVYISTINKVNMGNIQEVIN